jgi:peroxiredoxin
MRIREQERSEKKEGAGLGSRLTREYEVKQWKRAAKRESQKREKLEISSLPNRHDPTCSLFHCPCRALLLPLLPSL